MTSYRYPDSHVFYRRLGHEYPKIVRGEGCWLIDERGKRYLDAVGGAYVANLGHSNPEIAEAIARQARQFGYLSGTMFTHGPAEELAAEIAETLPGDLSKVYFLCSGSEAVEAALKLARQYWIERGRPSKNRIIALAPGYHGSTLLALSASAREAYKAMFRPWLVDVHRIPASYPYRCECGGQSATCPVCNGNVLEEAITRLGADQIAAFIAEPVGGSSTGASTPRPEYFRRVREICDRHDSGAFMHAQTFSHHPVACAAGVATMRYLKQHKLVERCAKMGRVLHERLAPLAQLPHVGDVRGRGLLAGIEFVEDKGSRAPFPRAARFAERFAEAALDAGLTVWPNVGHADGTSGDLAMVAPPFIVTEEEIGEIVKRFAEALEKVSVGARA